MRSFLLLFLFTIEAHAIFFNLFGMGGGGGGGCCQQQQPQQQQCCCPPPPRPQQCCCCPPQQQQCCQPAPMTCCAAPPPPPPPPPPPSYGCGGCSRRRKRSTVNIGDGGNFCNSKELEAILEENLKLSVGDSIDALKEAVAKKEDYHDYFIVCDRGDMVTHAHADEFCQLRRGSVTCTVLKVGYEKEPIPRDTVPMAPTLH